MIILLCKSVHKSLFIGFTVFICVLLFSCTLASANEPSNVSDDASGAAASVAVETDVAAAEKSARQDGKPSNDVAASVKTDVENTVAFDETSDGSSAVNTRSKVEEAMDDEGSIQAMEAKTFLEMHRMYNPNSGEHFYTNSDNERDSLTKIGWKYEGVGWMAPEYSTSPVYRLFNSYSSDHHYTLSSNERDRLVELGWNYEGIGWYSDDEKRVPVLRQFNPNETIGTHNFTTSEYEDKKLAESGWESEGIAWYAAALGTSSSSSTTEESKPSYIYLDAGHGIGSSSKGVRDPGAKGCGYEEADLTKELVTLTASYAKSLYGLNVYSNVDTDVEYWNRQKDAKERGCTSLVSIHFNESEGGTGSESFIHSKNASPRSEELQTIMHKHLVDGVGLRDRGMKNAAFAVCSAASTGLPATLLEICFIDSAYDMNVYQQRKTEIAKELAAGLFEASKAGF